MQYAKKKVSFLQQNTMKPKLKLAFSDMWGFEDYQFNPRDNYFTDLLLYIYEIKQFVIYFYKLCP